MEGKIFTRSDRRRIERRTTAHNPNATARVHQKTGRHWLQDVRSEHERASQVARAAVHVKKMLRQIPTAAMVEECPEVAYLCPDFPNLWALSEANRATLLAIPGMGEKRLLKIQDALAQRNISVRWAA
jgi:hypothetical protein